MPYDLMLLADPGPERERVLQLLESAPDIRRDADLDNRFWLRTESGEAQINIGTKDPVESIHVEFEIGDAALSEAVTRRSLALAEELDMRAEDMQYGHEISVESLPELHAFWNQLRLPPPVEPVGKKPWWRPW